MSNGTINKVIVQGRLGKDPEVRYLPSGMAVCNLRIATNSTRKDKESGERIDETEWHSISLFDKRAETAGQLLKKGWLVYFEGKMTTRKVPGKDGGEDRYFTEIRADEFQIIVGEKREGGEGGAPARAPAPAAASGNRGASKPAAAPAAGPDGDDDIPF